MSGYLPHNAWLGRSKWGLRIAFVFVIGLGAFLLKVWLWERYTLEVLVTEADVPLVCNRDSTALIGRRHPAARDFIPADAPAFYCGLVWTDHGPFKLPHTHAMPLVQAKRSALVPMLKEGCRYRIRVIGTGERPTKDPLQERNVGTLIRILEEEGCA